MFNALLSIAIIHAPANAPLTNPRPPAKVIPPIITAVIESNTKGAPNNEEPEPILHVNIKPAILERIAEII